MASLIARVYLVDGGLMKIPLKPDFLSKLKRLQANGLRGKALVHQLLTDDWGVPPSVIVITGTAPDGSPVDLSIPYD